MFPFPITRLSIYAQIPHYEHPTDSGADVRSIEDLIIYPSEWKAISTGLQIDIPSGYEIQVRPRSGLAFKHGVTVLNAPGTIDAGYQGEIKVILINHGWKPFVVNVGDRIAQLVISRVEVFSEGGAPRGDQGFGSTGVK